MGWTNRYTLLKQAMQRPTNMSFVSPFFSRSRGNPFSPLDGVVSLYSGHESGVIGRATVGKVASEWGCSVHSTNAKSGKTLTVRDPML
jgi:hypothetical protein